MIIIFFFWH